MSFLNSIKNNSTKYKIPFEHWEYSDALTEESIEEIIREYALSKANANPKIRANKMGDINGPPSIKYCTTTTLH